MFHRELDEAKAIYDRQMEKGENGGYFRVVRYILNVEYDAFKTSHLLSAFSKNLAQVFWS